MRTLTYLVATTLDGCIAESGGGDPTGSLFVPGQDYIARLIAHYPETLPASPTRARTGR